MLNTSRKYLHLWITLTSFAGFLAGWAYLAQAGRLITPKNSDPLSGQISVSLPPIQNVEKLQTLVSDSSSSDTGQVYKIDPATPTPLPQPTPVPQPLFLFKPVLRSAGS